ncbi:MAG: peptidylprolyl isomerase [Bacteroidales bacterium]|nr:peptidylprolyl isomerase [Bacteroidales bacterium]
MKSKITLLAICALALFACKNQSGDKPVLKEQPATEIVEKVRAEEPIFEVKTNMGTMKIKLYKETPLHRDNFVKLVEQKFYDGLLFHRVISGFMIQAGDPLSKDPAQVAKYGTGGPGYTVPAEILPQFTHKKGAIAAARKGDKANPNRESSGSQFYIVHSAEACASLDGQYTVYGETIEGLDVVDKIAAVATGAQKRDLPNEPVKIISIREIEQAPAAEQTPVQTPAEQTPAQ